MAEIRKHRVTSGQSAIARALEQALGASVRPVTPGAPPHPTDTDADEVLAPPTRPGIGVTSTAPTFTTGTTAPTFTTGTTAPTAAPRPTWLATRPGTPPRRDTDESAPGADD